MNINDVILFLGWCTVINLAILMITSIALFTFKGFIVSVHSKLTGVSITELPPLYFSYMANFKLAIILFNLTPYISLKLMS